LEKEEKEMEVVVVEERLIKKVGLGLLKVLNLKVMIHPKRMLSYEEIAKTITLQEVMKMIYLN
jgi:hypothetical protein